MNVTIWRMEFMSDLAIRNHRTLAGRALFKKFCKRDFCDEVRDFKIPEPEAVAS